MDKHYLSDTYIDKWIKIELTANSHGRFVFDEKPIDVIIPYGTPIDDKPVSELVPIDLT